MFVAVSSSAIASSCTSPRDSQTAPLPKSRALTPCHRPPSVTSPWPPSEPRSPSHPHPVSSNDPSCTSIVLLTQLSLLQRALIAKHPRPPSLNTYCDSRKI